VDVLSKELNYEPGDPLKTGEGRDEELGFTAETPSRREREGQRQEFESAEGAEVTVAWCVADRGCCGIGGASYNDRNAPSITV